MLANKVFLAAKILAIPLLCRPILRMTVNFFTAEFSIEIQVEQKYCQYPFRIRTEGRVVDYNIAQPQKVSPVQ